jgi:hypothetical protein
MTQEQVLEGNKLIACFVGYKYNIGFKSYELKKDGVVVNSIGLPLLMTGFKYNSSWDWLMPVVEKIESIKNSDDYEVDIFGKCCDIGGQFEGVCKTKIEGTYKAVVEFIKWHNKQQK